VATAAHPVEMPFFIPVGNQRVKFLRGRRPRR
jgi:hypothetical protein